jgi:YHS domain-containing protein
MKFAAVTFFILIPVVAAVLIGAPAVGLAKDSVNTNFRGIAVKGYDPVAYFTEAMPVKGKAKFEYRWQGAKWRFSSAKHLELFKAD